MPTTHLKITNNVAADRIALAVLEKYDLRNSLEEALQYLVNDGELERTLGCYRGLMMQRDITSKDLTDRSEADHRDSFSFCHLRNHFLVPRVEFEVIKVIHYSLLARQYLTSRVGRQNKWSYRSCLPGSRMADSYRMEILSNPVPKCTS